MGKKFTLVLGLLMMVLAINAQTLLREDFESCTVMPPNGWTVIDDVQPGTVNHWILYEDDKAAVAGVKSAYCDAGSFTYDEPAKEEWLITPALVLDDNTYKLEYKWVGASAAAIEKQEYDFKIRISDNDGKTWTDVWSFLNKEQVEKSGVLFPWAAWAKNTSIINLSAWKGKTIKIAFVHCKLVAGLGKGNCVKLDDILVEKYTPIEKPVAEGSGSYIFNGAYMGVKKYSEPLSIRNVGVDTLKILSIEGLEGTDFSTNIVPGDVKLSQKQEYRYNAIYTPTLTGARNATMTIKTNGGDINVALQGTKLVLPANYTLESFEGDVYPPLGWTSASEWKRYGAGFSGDFCVYSSLSSNGELMTPRLDLSAGGPYTITFDMLEDYTPASDDAVGPENELELYFTSNGGKSWSKLNFQNLTLNEIVRYKVDLGSPASDNCYVKFRYAMELDLSGGYDEIPEYSTIFVDDVVLPPLYGRDAAPVAATNPVPANNAINVQNEDLKLSWGGSQFATGYKLYVGTSENNFDIVNGESLTATSYEIALLENNTKYYWKVIPFNAVGESADVKVWQFTTMADQSIKTFPYFEGFEGDAFPTLGWQSIKGGAYGGWSRTNINPFDGTYSALVSSNLSNTQDILQSPPVQLPNDKDMQISFYWGNSVPSGLTKPKAPSITTVVDNDTLYLEIKSNGEWNVLASLSTLDKENQSWARERIMLSAYKGQTVAFRWRYSVMNGMKATGGALDNIMIEEAAMGGKAVINAQSWNAGSVNYKKSYSSGTVFALLNDGEQPMTLKNISFKSNNFMTSLAPNTVIASRESIPFSVTFNAGDANKLVQDTMLLEFENAATIKFPVEGTALSSTVRYFSFDEDEFGSVNPQGFTMIDVDRAATCRPVFINYPNYGGAYAFIVINQKPEPEGADWRNIYPRSGDQMLAAMSPQVEGLSSNDWIVSEKMTARDHAQFRFYAKSYGDTESFESSKVSVWVSTTDNKQASFVPVANAQNMVVPHIDNHSNKNFTEFVVDLSAWKGQQIYVALQHTVSYNGFVAFFDDFYYEDFDFGAEENSAPIFMSTPVEKATIGQVYTYNLQVYDADSDPVTIKNTGLPSWLTFTPNATGGVYTGTPTTLGEVMFRISASDGKVSVSQDVVIDVTDGSGVEEVNAAKVKVYPNPVRNVLCVEGTDVEAIQVYDLTGNLVLSKVGTNEISVESLIAGTYIVRVQSAGQVYSTRVVKM